MNSPTRPSSGSSGWSSTALGEVDAGAARVPLSRLVTVELRKMVDTLAGRWLMAAVVAITLVAALALLLAGNDSDRTFANFLGVMATPQGFLLPVLGILLVTQEWGQRTGMVTFTLEPRRSKVITAKVVAAAALGLLAVLLAFALAALATLLAGEPGAWREVGASELSRFALLQLLGIVQGLAFGLIFLNTAGAIVTYSVVPLAFTVLASTWAALRDAQPWIDLGYSQQPLFGAGALTGEQWAQLATSVLLWVLLPFLLGLWRVLRAEVK